ncbi:ATP-binding protein [Denitrobaculum tricleocarpae]|uniref:histidine kinase n=1 Tax=Denitrobaculum tricleocarpae TaxID=2591009 RepID=A0A545TML0_9PROT|nr:ATP-binding protein [Denitrobaculum tricleocarpae]TQV78472.1 HAMP domain-containing protein [Denitrobaculum tricleocarpae]
MSFRLKTVLGIAAIECVLLAILVISGLHYLRSSNEAQLLERSQVTARLFSTMTSDALLSLDLATLDALVGQTLQNDDILYVRVRNANGLVVAQGGDSGALEADFLEDDSIETTSNDMRLDVSAPIVSAGKDFGRVEIGLSTATIETTLGDATRWMLSIAAMEILLVAVFGLLLGTVLTKQLALLRKGAKRVAQGDFGYQLRVTGRDELADTSNSFNRMSRALAEFAKEAEEARRKAEAEREHAETVMRDAMNSMDQSVVIVDARDRIEFVNEAFKETYPDITANGNMPQSFVELSCLLSEQLEPADDDGESLNALLESAAPSAGAGITEDMQWQSRTLDGRVLMNSRRQMSNGGVVVVETDITELFDAVERNRHLEMEVMQSQKMESLGTLASGIAHEINTPIQYVGDNVKFARESFCDLNQALLDLRAGKGDLETALEEMDWEYLSEEVPRALQEATDGVQAVSRIVSSVKALSHGDNGEKTLYDLSSLIENVVTVSKNQWKYCAEIRCDTDDQLGQVPCFPGDLSQVLINMVVNAAQAIEEAEEVRAGLIRIAARREDDEAQISIVDNGNGIPEDKIERIFDLFFTTKAPGVGTGQGLAISRSIIEEKHGGRLSVESEVGVGTTFRISLPLADAA